MSVETPSTGSSGTGSALIAGVTGNSGCGQTSLAGLLEQRGAAVFSLDAVGHRLLDKRYVRRDLARILDDDRVISAPPGELRKRLGGEAFSDETGLAAAERVTHQRMVRWARLMVRVWRGSGGVVLLEGALLYELGIAELMDFVIVVRSDLTSAARRLYIRDRVPERITAARWARQMPIGRKDGVADLVIYNDSGRDALESAADIVWDRLLRVAAGQASDCS
ncbi:dephospho-CoA kinase [Candidatus Fermentibacterales bacterium]|nr:dephospho-CoA kinase [Candidatus Fermentibacterales bacterium]